MDVILLKDIKGKGSTGDQIVVKEGYARNFLFPYKYAMPATPENIRHFKSLKNKQAKELAEQKSDFEALAKVIDGKTIEVSQKTNKGKLYGSYTPAQLISDLKESFKVDVSRQAIQMPDHIKETGQFSVDIKLHPEVTCAITVNISSESEVSEPTTLEEAEVQSTPDDAADATESPVVESTPTV